MKYQIWKGQKRTGRRRGKFLVTYTKYKNTNKRSILEDSGKNPLNFFVVVVVLRLRFTRDSSDLFDAPFLTFLIGKCVNVGKIRQNMKGVEKVLKEVLTCRKLRLRGICDALFKPKLCKTMLRGEQSSRKKEGPTSLL